MNISYYDFLCFECSGLIITILFILLVFSVGWDRMLFCYDEIDRPIDSMFLMICLISVIVFISSNNERSNIRTEYQGMNVAILRDGSYKLDFIVDYKAVRFEGVCLNEHGLFKKKQMELNLKQCFHGLDLIKESIDQIYVSKKSIYHLTKDEKNNNPFMNVCNLDRVVLNDLNEINCKNKNENEAKQVLGLIKNKFSKFIRKL